MTFFICLSGIAVLGMVYANIRYWGNREATPDDIEKEKEQLRAW